MIAAVILLAAVVVALAGALVAQTRGASKERGMLADEWATERSHLIDVIVAKHSGELVRLNQSQRVAESPEVEDYRKDLDRQLRDMGYDPDSVPGVPEGLG